MQRLGIEWRMKGAHLIEEHSKGPDVSLKTVLLVLDDLWSEVVWGSNHSFGLRLGVTENSGDTEVTKLDHTACSEEDILGLKITMQYFSIVNMFKSQAYLSKPVQDMILVPVL